ncbi:MRN complex-interacting protein [Planococcus citri]|uniref:MRN complex-interacting protein n=1 Tax=Planococcus citri TaxID=170843 RepID=UPI0031F99640
MIILEGTVEILDQRSIVYIFLILVPSQGQVFKILSLFDSCLIQLSIIMVQEFHVLKCHQCELFQVHIVKKAKKWECKVCGAKQSVVKVFGQGSAKDCRIHVQKLNEQRSQNLINSKETPNESNDHCELETATSNTYEEHSLEEYVDTDRNRNCDSEFRKNELPSKWQKYIEPDRTDESYSLESNSNVEKCSLESSWNLMQVQDDKLSELKSAKLPCSKDDSQVGNHGRSLSSSWNSIQLRHDELSELKSEKLICSRDGFQVGKKRKSYETDSNSEKIFHFLSHDELDTVDDILDV